MQPDSETQLRLKQQDATLVISSLAWRELLEAAQTYGWESEHPPACYWGDVGLSVTDSDARRLATGFEAMGDHLVDSERDPEEIAEFISTLGELAIFCRTGGFRVC